MVGIFLNRLFISRPFINRTFQRKIWDLIFEKKISKNFFNGFRGVNLVVFSAQVLTNLRMEIV